jgi:cytochrome P450
MHEELDRVLAGRLPELDDVAELSYTRAVIKESMRLYPPVPILSRQCRNDDVIRDKKVPAGSIVLVVPWLLQRHEKYWEKPHHFVPERFTGEWSQLPDKHAYIPFGAGPRFCLGAAFGITEAVLCMATLAQRFKPRLKPNHQVGYECRLTLRPKDGLPMVLELR